MNDIVFVGRHGVTFNVPRHSHASLELIYCTGGEGCFTFCEKRMEYREGDIVAIPPGVPHVNDSEGGFTNIYVNIAEPSVKLQEPLLFRDGPNGFLRSAFQAANYHFSVMDGRPHALLNAYGHLLVCYLDASGAETRTSRVVTEITQAIIQNYQNPDFALDEYLRSLPFSYDYLRRLFKKEMGVTPHNYLMNKRLHAASNLLSLHYEGNNISEVSLLCGFREPLYFSRMFKKQFGVSPSRYEEMHRAGGQGLYLEAENVKIFPSDSDE